MLEDYLENCQKSEWFDNWANDGFWSIQDLWHDKRGGRSPLGDIGKMGGASEDVVLKNIKLRPFSPKQNALYC